MARRGFRNTNKSIMEFDKSQLVEQEPLNRSYSLQIKNLVMDLILEP